MTDQYVNTLLITLNVIYVHFHAGEFKRRDILQFSKNEGITWKEMFGNGVTSLCLLKRSS